MIQGKNFVTIQGWMRTELNLKGNELIVYAVIYGFSQTEEQWYTGSLQYLADWCGATKQGVLKNLKSLTDGDRSYNSDRIYQYPLLHPCHPGIS